MRRLLVVAGWYPPCENWPTAARRISSLVRGLPAAGWAPTVLLPDLTGGMCGCDRCQAGDPPTPFDGVDVRRLPVRATLLRRLDSARRRGGVPSSQPVTDARTGTPPLLKSLAWALNETQSTWGKVVATDGLALARAGRFDALLTTSGPFDHITAARRIQRALGVPWVADLRDPATVDVTLEGTPVERLVRAGRRGACRALRHADRLVAATEQVVDRDRAALGQIDLLLPGFDAEEWSAARQQAIAPARFEIVFAGRLYTEYRRPDVFLRGLHALAATDHLGPEVIQLVYYGREGGELLEIARREGCAHLVRDAGFVRPTEMPSRLASASALLLLTNDAGASGVPGGKFYEYLAAHRPILAVPGADRFVVSTLQHTGAGVAADDPQDVAAVLRAWLHEWQQAGHLPFTGDAAAIERFSDAASVERLAHLLDACREGARSR